MRQRFLCHFAVCTALALCMTPTYASSYDEFTKLMDLRVPMSAAKPSPEMLAAAKQLDIVTQRLTNQLPTLGIWPCDDMGQNCHLVMVNPSPRERYVLYGALATQSVSAPDAAPTFSARSVFNGSAPGQPVVMFDRVYSRMFNRQVPYGERQFFEIILGQSWGTITELSVTPFGSGQCTWFALEGDNGSSRILIVADHTTCDAPDEPVVVRWVSTVRENDLPTDARAPITVLKSVRSGYQVIDGDAILREWTELGDSLPSY